MQLREELSKKRLCDESGIVLLCSFVKFGTTLEVIHEQGDRLFSFMDLPFKRQFLLQFLSDKVMLFVY